MTDWVVGSRVIALTHDGHKRGTILDCGSWGMHVLLDEFWISSDKLLIFNWDNVVLECGKS